ncbi:MAG: tyrosine-type recombinase/integrase [Acidimicrobiales bacterium]
MSHQPHLPEQSLQQVIDGWLASLSSPHTRAAYRTDVGVYVQWCADQRRAPLDPAADTVAAFRRFGDATAGRSTVARRHAALNAFLRHIGALPVASPAPADSPAPGAAPHTASTAPASSTVGLVPDERTALLESIADDARASSTTRTLVGLLLLDGLKLDEALRLDVGDVAGRPPAVRLTLDRPGGPQVTMHPWSGAAAAAHVRGRAARDPLFVSASRREAPGSRLSRFGADYLLRQAGRRAGLDAPLTSNVLRRTHAEHARAGGESLDDIARRMGHDDLRSTRRYLTTPTSPAPTALGAGRAHRRYEP